MAVNFKVLGLCRMTETFFAQEHPPEKREAPTQPNLKESFPGGLCRPDKPDGCCHKQCNYILPACAAGAIVAAEIGVSGNKQQKRAEVNRLAPPGGGRDVVRRARGRVDLALHQPHEARDAKSTLI